jgi:asparagine synthase (glutamine-hydrolysing)
MCGIYLTNIPFKEEEIKQKLETIKFRGPDYTGVLQQEGLSFGHLRLSIIDLESRSNQPMVYDNFTIVFNGEIYNFKEVKEELIQIGYVFDTTGDTEVLLKSYCEWGEEMTNKINGMFAFAIYNKAANTIFCARDRLGVKPFYYYWNDGQFEICSQLRPISNGKTINKEAISIYLDCSYIPSPYTIFNDVNKLAPGKNMLIDLTTKTLKISEYWNLNKVKLSDISYEDAVEKTHDILKNAVKIRLQADVPFGSFLSGGIDSALITSIASKVHTAKIKTFSIGFDDPKYDESKVAKKYAEILDTQHTETICSPSDVMEMISKFVEVYDEPFADSSALPSLLLNKVTKQHVTMALSGDGGDESFLGYNHFDWVSKFNLLVKFPYFIRYISSFLIFPIMFKQRTDPIKTILRTRNVDRFIEMIFLGFNTLLKKRDFNWLSNYPEFNKLSSNNFQKTADLNIKLWLENDSNVKVDRASMAYSVEIRSPFLDYRIIELARSFPVSYRYKKGVKKRILRDILKKYIPEDVFNHPKKGFSIPIAHWIRHELKEEFIENLNDEFLNIIPNFDIEKFKDMFAKHLSGHYDYSSYIWKVYVLSKWYKEFGFYSDDSKIT